MSRSTLRREAHMKGECDEHDRCVQRDKAECEWCPWPATTPANPTEQIATVAATPAVAPDAQRYDWRKDLDNIEACEEVWECADGCCTYFTPRHNNECIRLAAYIERLEAERDALRLRVDELSRMVDAGLQVSAERVIRGE